MDKAYFEPMFGFMFNRGGLKKEPDWNPGHHHPLWKAIDKWYDRFQKQAKRDAVSLAKEYAEKEQAQP